MIEQFIAKKFAAKSKAVVEKANVIIAEYQAQGFTLTLRQLYYQFVARGFLPNKQKEYKRLGSICNDARLAGLMDWDAIEDRTRFLRKESTWEKPKDIIHDAAETFTLDWWKTQKYRPEVWIEKDALIGIIEPVCLQFQVPYYACRGYSSQSEQYRAGKRLNRYADEGFIPVIFHLGDHDPSGMDMTRDNEDRLDMFAEAAIGNRAFTFDRLALNMDQVRRYNPPPNPNKETDSRTGEYARKFGNSCWELDALNPPVVAALLKKAILKLIDQRKWAAMKRLQEKGRNQLRKVARRMR